MSDYLTTNLKELHYAKTNHKEHLAKVIQEKINKNYEQFRKPTAKQLSLWKQ